MIAPCQSSALLITPTIVESPTIVSSSLSAAAVETASASASGTAKAAGLVVDDDCFEDGCSICLEPFSSIDPPNVTSCKHEYHLQCIIEWSQRSKECPICWQQFVLEDPTSQELLAAVGNERMVRSSTNTCPFSQQYEVDHGVPSIDESEFEEGIRRHFIAARNIAQLVNRRRRESSSISGPSVSVAATSNMSHIPDSPEENKTSRYGVEVGLPASVPPPSSIESDLSTGRRDGHRVFLGQTSPDGEKSSSSELLAFSESVKAKLSAASSKYKESFSKGTRGFKEKLLARNSSVKELSRGVQREMGAGIAGVARIIERFDLSSKRPGHTVSKEIQQHNTAQPLAALSGETAEDRKSGIFIPNSGIIPGQVEVSCAQTKD